MTPAFLIFIIQMVHVYNGLLFHPSHIEDHSRHALFAVHITNLRNNYLLIVIAQEIYTCKDFILYQKG